MKVVVATRNRHKVREIAVLLAEAGLGIEAVTIDDVAPLAELVENEDTFEGNALAKARQAAAACGPPAIADDSGIEVDALAMAPGVRSARWAGEPCDDGRNNQKMLREMADVPTDKRTARYRCAAAFVDGVRGVETVRSGACEGVLLTAPRGSGDPVNKRTQAHASSWPRNSSPAATGPARPVCRQPRGPHAVAAYGRRHPPRSRL